MKTRKRFLLAFLMLTIFSISAWSQGSVSFTADNTNGCTPLTVNFTNTSTIDTNGVKFTWNFQDGQESFGYHSVHTFKNPGNYNVQLSAFKNGNSQGGFSMNINVQGVADNFNMSTHEACPNQEVQFGYSYQFNSISWDFGDGTYENYNSWPRHTYSVPGTYTVKAIVQTNGCPGKTIEQQLLVSNTAKPDVQINVSGGNYHCPNDAIYFRSNNEAVAYLWNFGDGTTSSEKDPTHAYSVADTFRVILTLTNMCGNKNSDTTYVYIINDQQVWVNMNFWPNPACPFDPVNFDCYNSGSFLWEFGDGVKSTQKSVEHFYTTPGNYTVKLTVSNHCGFSQTETRQMIVQLNPNMNKPEAQIEFDNFENNVDGKKVDTIHVCPGTYVSFRNNSWCNSNNCKYLWKFGAEGTAPTEDASHTFNTNGIIKVEMIISNTCGAKDTAYKWVDVNSSQQPHANLQILPDTICPGEKVYFMDDNFQGKSSGNIYNIWFGDGDSLKNINDVMNTIPVFAAHIYKNIGKYIYTFSVKNTCGQTLIVKDTIVVNTTGKNPPFYYVGNSTQKDQSGPLNIPDWSVQKNPTDHLFNISLKMDEWTPAFDNHFLVAFWVDKQPEQNTPPDGMVMTNGPTTVKAYVPNIGSVVMIGAVWYCDGVFGEDPDAMGMPQTLYPFIPGGTTNVPQIDLEGWDGKCEDNSGCPGDTIQFMIVGGKSYKWYFGDGVTDTSQFAQHVYTNTGNYDAFVVVSTACGDKDTIQSPVRIGDYNVPDAWFEVSSDNVCPGEKVDFIGDEDSNDGLEVQNDKYLWAFGDGATSTQKNTSHIYLNPGQYTVTLTVTNGCGSNAETRTIYVGSMNVDGYVKNVCEGGTDGYISLNVNGNAPFIYSWSNNQTTMFISNLSPGNYDVTITDSHACTTERNFTIVETDEISMNFAISHITCKNNHDGIIEVNPTGGTFPYQYKWSNGQSSRRIENLNPGKYIVTVTDINGCTDKDSAVILEPAFINLQLNVTNPSCNFSSDGSIDLVVTGGTSPFTYSWNIGQMSEDIENLTQGNYSVFVTDKNGCSAQNSTDLNDPDPITYTMQKTDVLCPGGKDGSININNLNGGTSPYSYKWSNGAISQNINNLYQGSYTVTVTDSKGCSYANSMTVFEQLLGFNISTNHQDAGCGLQNGSGWVVTVTGGGNSPYTYQWDDPSTQTTQTMSNVSAGTYHVIVTSSDNCKDTTTVTINNIGGPSISFISKTDVSCHSLCNGQASVNATGGTGVLTYKWSNNQTTKTITGLCAGNYDVTVTDENTCIAAGTTEIMQPQLIKTVMFKLNVLCYSGSDGSANVNISGGTSPYQVIWSNGATTEDINNVIAGKYKVTVTDVNGCAKLDSVTINQPAEIITSIIPQHVTCPGSMNGSVDLTVSGGIIPYQYHWSNGQNSQDIGGLNGGTYKVTVTDANNCVKTDQVVINEPAVISVTSTAINVLCFGGSSGAINITVNGGTTPFNYVWSNGSTNQNISVLMAGTYYVTITDKNGCTKVYSKEITQPVELSANESHTNVSCAGGSNGAINITVTGGTPDYAFLWSNTSTDEDISGLTAGNYSVTITDKNNCVFHYSVGIIEPNLLTTSFLKANVLCNGGDEGSVNLSVNGGVSPFAYKWSNNATTQDIGNLVAGEYCVTVTDKNSCATTTCVTITEPTAISASIKGVNVSCHGGSDGSADLTVSGGTQPYSYIWTDLSVTQDINNLKAGKYCVTVSDKNLCESSACVTITEPATVMTVQVTSSTNVTCNGGNIGAVNITATGGVLPYDYEWSNDETTEDLSGIEAGVYCVSVSDDNGCSATTCVTITEPVKILLTASSTNATCNQSDGAVSVSATGGTGSFKYQWNDPSSSTTQTVSGLPAGIYSVTATDDNNCTAVGFAVINNAGGPIIDQLSATDVTCNGLCNGSVSVTVSGGGGTYTYLWSNNATTQSISSLCAGKYTVTVSDQNGCKVSGIDTVYQPAVLTANVTTTIETSSGTKNGTATVTGNGGALPYTYKWDDLLAQTTQTATGLSTGTYHVTVTDKNGCTVVVSGFVDVGTSIAVVEQGSYVLYPNPTSGYVTIELTDLTVSKVAVFDVTGRVVLVQENRGNIIRINLEGYNSGTYFIRLITNNKVYNEKITLDYRF